jgi:hypothetical protein
LFFSTDFQKYTNIKFHENSSSGSRRVACEQTGKYDEGTVALGNSANKPKNTQAKASEIEIYKYRNSRLNAGTAGNTETRWTK